MKLDRTLPPQIKTASKIDFLKAKTSLCSNGVPIYYINHGEQEVVRLQFVFDGGTYFQEKPLVASTVNSMLVEGTESHTSLEIANYFENRGAFIDMDIEADVASLSLYCLTKNVEELLPLIDELFTSANFPQEELDTYLSIRQQNFAVNSQKVSFMAKNNFLTAILGEQSRYANKLESNHYKDVKRSDLISFYKNHYQNGRLSIYASGKVGEKMIRQLDKQFGSSKRGDSEYSGNSQESIAKEKNANELLINKKGALQSAIRLGKAIVSKSHPDFPALFFTNAVLGGYFGSRLMSNIREDKGYTYGIGSGLVSYKNAAYFVISTEVGAEVTEATLIEIEKEVTLLQQETISEFELNLVKNYLSGSILKNFDGAFAAMDRFRSINELGLDYNYYDNLIKEIREMNALKVRDIAQKHLTYKSFTKVIAGKV